MGDPTPTGGITPDQDTTTTGNAGDDKGGGAEYVAFGLVPVFFLLGLLGVLICHALKKKGYRCTTEAEDKEEGDDLEKDLENGDLNDTYSEGNTDTVGQIVHYIMKNEANTDALKAMVRDNSIDSDGMVTPTSPVTPTTPGPVTPGSPGLPPGVPGAAALALPASKHTCNHLHTIGGSSGLKNTCQRCSQKKWPVVRRHSKVPDRRSHTGEVTVLAVGRFRVTKCDPKAGGKERRTLLITEPNGTATEPAPEEERRPSQPSQTQEDAVAK